MFRRSDPGQPSTGLFYGWYVVGALFFMVLIGIGPRQGFGLFFDVWSDEFGVNVTTLSAIAAGGWVVNGVMQLLAGGLTDRFGGRVVMAVSMLILGIATILMGMATNIWLLAVVYVAVVSASQGGVLFVPATPVVVRWFRRRLGAAMGVLSAGASVGGMLLIPFMAYLLILVDWRLTWVVIGMAMLVLSFPLLLLVVRNSPREMGLLPDGDEAFAGTQGEAEDSIEQPGPLAVDRWRTAYRSAPMWQLTSGYIVCGVSTGIISVHFVPFALDKDISISTAAFAFGLLSFVNMVSVVGVSILSDRLQRKNVLAVAYAVRGASFVALVVLPAPFSLWVFAVTAGASWLATVPQTSALVAEVYGVKKSGSLNGMLNMLHQFGGAAAVFLAGSTFTALNSYTPAFLVTAAFLALASFVSWFLRERQCSVRFVEAVPGLLSTKGA
jgi:MFS family permease